MRLVIVARVPSRGVTSEIFSQDNYAGLCGLLMPRLVRDKVDLESVTAIADAMAGHRLNAGYAVPQFALVRVP